VSVKEEKKKSIVHNSDNLKIIIIKLNKEHRKNIPKVETHVHLDPCCHCCVCCSDELVSHMQTLENRCLHMTYKKDKNRKKHT
jgi:hypothetical protein